MKYRLLHIPTMTKHCGLKTDSEKALFNNILIKTKNIYLHKTNGEFTFNRYEPNYVNLCPTTHRAFMWIEEADDV